MTLLRKKKSISPNGNQALPKNKPADNWVGAFNLISHVSLTGKGM